MKRAAIAVFLAAVVTTAHAADNQWFVAQHNGCLHLEELFPPVHTPEEALKGLNRNADAEHTMRIKYVSPGVTTFHFPYEQMPPLVMVKGYQRCMAIVERWNNPYGY